MRLHIRTSKRTGVSVGPIGLAALGFGWLIVLALPVVAVEWCFGHWYTAPLGVLLIVVAMLAAIGSALER